MKKIVLKMPSNPTKDDKAYAIECILDQFINKKGNFDIQGFAKNFTSVQEAINKFIPDWQLVINEIPLYADDYLTGKFKDILSKVDPDPVDFVDLARNLVFDTTGSVKQFSNDGLDWNTDIPPVNDELIVYNPLTGLYLQASAKRINDYTVEFKNLSIGGDFRVPIDLLKWLPAKRFNDVKTADVTSVDLREFSRKDNLSALIKTYIKR